MNLTQSQRQLFLNISLRLATASVSEKERSGKKTRKTQKVTLLKTLETA